MGETQALRAAVLHMERYRMAIEAEVNRRMANDEVLRRKVEQLRELLAKFCPELNDAFWQQVARAR